MDFAIRTKLIDILTKLSGFKLIKILVIEFKNINSDDAAK